MSFELGIKVGFFPPNSQLNVDMVIVADGSAAMKTNLADAAEPKPGLQVWFQKDFVDRRMTGEKQQYTAIERGGKSRGSVLRD